MFEFKEYESRPIVRKAFQLTDKMSWFLIEDSTWMITASNLRFKAYQKPESGDWIVRLTDIDTYHVTDTVFRERNIMP